MNITTIKYSLTTALLVSVFSYQFSDLLAQGSLTPPGAPAMTMKTLDQIEPRTLITSLPFNITSGGSYYLATNLTGSSGFDGITIQADNVTIDLNGFSLVGVPGSLHGISVPNAQQNLSIYSGTVTSWGAAGIDAHNASNAQFEQLRLAGNGGAGISVGTNSMVARCAASGNLTDGLFVFGPGNRIEENNLTKNHYFGITTLAPGNLVVKNYAANNLIGDYDFSEGTSYGQIVPSPGSNFTNATAWVNFSLSSCPAGQVFCGGICVDLTSRVNNCGACGHVCPSVANGFAACSGGACVIGCNAGFANCGGVCQNLQTDPNNCGACGHTCLSGHACVNGACQ